MKKILSIALLALLTIGVANAQTADAIAKKYVNAIGGAAKWKAMKSSKATITLNQQGFDIPGYIIGDASNRQRLQLEFQGMKMIQATDGTTAWGVNPFAGETAPSKMQGDQAKEMNETQFLDELIDYKKRGYTLSLEGEADMEGTACHKLKLISKSGDENTIYIDKETNLKIAEEGVSAGQNILTVFSDYKESEGVMVPMKFVQKSGGATLFTVTISKVEYNVEVSDDQFSFPSN